MTAAFAFLLAVQPVAADVRVELRPGLTIEGALTREDARAFDGERHDLLRFEGRADQTYVFEIRARGFEPALAVLDGDDVEVMDEGDGGPATRVTFQPRYDGVYAVRVEARAPRDLGAYSLRMDEARAEPAG